MQLSREQIMNLVRKEIEESHSEVTSDHLREKSPGAWEAHVTASLEFLREAEEDLARSHFRSIARRAQQILDDNGIRLDETSGSFRLLCRELLRATIELQREDLRLHNGKSAHNEQPYLLQASPTPVAATQPKTTPLLSEVLEAFINEKQQAKKVGISSIESYREAVSTFVFVVGDKPVGEITHDDACRFRDACRQIPTNRTKNPNYKNKTIDELLALELPESICLSGKTINDRLSILSAIFQKHLIPKRLADLNVFEGVKTHLEDSRSYTEFDSDDLRVITTSAIYVDSKYSRSSKTTASRWWLPLLGFWTGARVGELTQMHLSDIQEIDGILCAVVDDDEEDGKRVKTNAARRTFPIHSALLELGFRDYVEQVRASGATRLLESIPLGSRKPGEVASKWFNETYRARHLPSEFKEDKKVFHSLRRTFITAGLNAKIDLLDLQSMVGHEPKQLAETATYYGKRDVRRLKESLELVQFPSVDLASLRNGWKRFKRL
uniref:site-specific integrase n=1 Tax=Microbulbifer agarilyticus TaxID=260552 RepID=UPI00130348B9|nr:site-specific integrase [Microbulbifer agarilyticus]